MGDDDGACRCKTGYAYNAMDMCEWVDSAPVCDGEWEEAGDMGMCKCMDGYSYNADDRCVMDMEPLDTSCTAWGTWNWDNMRCDCNSPWVHNMDGTDCVWNFDPTALDKSCSNWGTFNDDTFECECFAAWDLSADGLDCV